MANSVHVANQYRRTSIKLKIDFFYVCVVFLIANRSKLGRNYHGLSIFFCESLSI